MTIQPYVILNGSANGISFHGPAPLHHTLLSGCERTGVTVQTLHPKNFDQGRILAQIPQPGWKHQCVSVQELSTQLGAQGADMLVDCIKNRLYLYGSSDLELLSSSELENDSREFSLASARHAPKITKDDRYIDWDTMTAADILRRHKVIGPLWNTVDHKRVIWSEGFELASHMPAQDLPVGQPIVMGSDQGVYVRTSDAQILQISGLKIEGGVPLEPLKAAYKAGMHDPTLSDQGPLFRFRVS